MKIAHVACTFPPYRGGIGKSALDFSLMMADSNHQVEVYTPLYTKVYTENNYSKIKVIRIKPFLKFGNGAFIPSLFFELKKFDLVYLHYPFFGAAELVWLFGFFNKKTKIILHYHMDVIGLSPFFKFLSLPSSLIEKSLLKRADLITAGSLDYIENSKIGRFYRRNKNKFRETFFPVDVEKFYPREDREKRKVKQILFVGGLDRAHYFKGLDVLIDSLSLLSERSDWSLRVVGRGGLKEKYRNKCRDNNIDNRVQFLDSVSDEELPRVYRDSDFFVLPSINKGEAFGIVLLEAMSSGLPVLASSLAGVRSVFSEKEGFLLKPNDIQDLASNIKYCLDNDELMNKMSISARILAQNKYSYEKVSERINNIVSDN